MLSSCGPNYHIRKARRHLEKAREKDPNASINDTTRQSTNYTLEIKRPTIEPLDLQDRALASIDSALDLRPGEIDTIRQIIYRKITLPVDTFLQLQDIDTIITLQLEGGGNADLHLIIDDGQVYTHLRVNQERITERYIEKPSLAMIIKFIWRNTWWIILIALIYFAWRAVRKFLL
jgi:hypothetical protein